MSLIAMHEAPPRTPLKRRRTVAVALVLLAIAALVVALLARTARDAEEVIGGGVMESARGLAPQFAAHLEKHPGDARAWAIYARLTFARGEYAQSAVAYARAVELPGKVARDPFVWCEYADALAMTAGGRLAGKPRELIEHALALDPKNPRALEMAGSAEIEAGNFAAALDYWESLLAVLPADSPARDELTKAIERTRMRAGR